MIVVYGSSHEYVSHAPSPNKFSKFSRRRRRRHHHHHTMKPLQRKFTSATDLESLDDKDTNDESLYSSQELRIASRLVVLLGIGNVLGFCTLTQPVDYWHELVPTHNLESYIPVVYMGTNLLTLGTLVFGKNSADNRWGDMMYFSHRIAAGLGGQMLLLLLLPFIYYYCKSYAFVLVLLLTALLAMVTALLDSSLLAMVAQYFPAHIQESFQIGIGLSSLVSSLYRDVTKMVMGTTIVPSTNVYFGLAACTLAVCLFALGKLLSLNITQRAIQQQRESKEEASPLLLESTANNDYCTINRTQVYYQIWRNELIVCVNFALTLSLWPAIVTQIPSWQYQGTTNWTLILLTLFSILDCSGRYMTQLLYNPFDTSTIGYAVALRIVLAPLLMACATGWLHHDGLSLLLVALLGWSNGYVGTLAIVLVSDCVDASSRALAGTVTSFAINSGLVLGATMGMILTAMWVR